MYKCSDQRRLIPIGMAYWLLKNYVDASAISVVARFLFLTPAPVDSPLQISKSICDSKKRVQRVTLHLGLEGDAEAVALPRVL